MTSPVQKLTATLLTLTVKPLPKPYFQSYSTLIFALTRDSFHPHPTLILPSLFIFTRNQPFVRFSPPLHSHSTFISPRPFVFILIHPLFQLLFHPHPTCLHPDSTFILPSKSSPFKVNPSTRQNTSYIIKRLSLLRNESIT